MLLRKEKCQGKGGGSSSFYGLDPAAQVERENVLGTVPLAQRIAQRLQRHTRLQCDPNRITICI